MKLMKSMSIKSLLVLLVGVMMFSSCSKKEGHLSVIPEDSIFVFSIDVPALAKKANLKELDKLNSYNLIKSKLQGEMSAEGISFLEELKKDPSKTGLSLTSDILAFAYGDLSNTQGAAVAELASKKKFELFLADVMAKIGEEYQVEEDGGVNMAVIDGESVLFWDDSKVLVAGDRTEGLRLFNLPANEKLTGNASFNKFYQGKKDISFWMGFDSILKNEDIREEIMSDPEIAGIMGNYLELFKGTYMSTYLNFGKKDITMSFSVEMNDKMKEVYKKHNILGKMDDKLMKYLPKETYIIFSGATNMEASFEAMKEMGLEAMYNKLDEQLAEGTGGMFTMTQFFKTIKGDFIVSLHGVDDQFSIIPLFSFVAGLNDRAMLDNVINMIPEGVVTKQLNCYEINALDFPLYFTYDDKALLVSTDWNVASSFVEGGLKENLTSSPVAKSIKSYPAYGFLSLDYETYPNVLKQQMGSAAGMIKPFDDFFVNMEVKALDNQSGEYVINVEHNSSNSLEGFIKLLDTSVLPMVMMFM
ncbi:DUF4836 family protein [Bacteroidales bacterium OttesenSCG-928-L03]|nr:DUF4836 family protein [Bacteroidales bacterium OttesenSCG-928-L03]